MDGIIEYNTKRERKKRRDGNDVMRIDIIDGERDREKRKRVERVERVDGDR